MSVTVLIPGALRADCGGASRLQVDPAADPEAAVDLEVVLDELGRSWPRLHRRIRDEQGSLRRFVNVYVDGEDCRAIGGLAARVRGGSEIQILPSVAGGAGPAGPGAPGRKPGWH